MKLGIFKPPTGPTERTPKKPEYLIARSQLTERGPLVNVGKVPFNFDGKTHPCKCNHIKFLWFSSF